jgi:hypothetical protein
LASHATTPSPSGAGSGGVPTNPGSAGPAGAWVRSGWAKG